MKEVGQYAFVFRGVTPGASQAVVGGAHNGRQDPAYQECTHRFPAFGHVATGLRCGTGAGNGHGIFPPLGAAPLLTEPLAAASALRPPDPWAAANCPLAIAPMMASSPVPAHPSIARHSCAVGR